MKRIKAACICQTLHFMLKEDAEHDWAVKQVEQEVEQYKKTLERRLFNLTALLSSKSSSSITVLQLGIT